MILGFYEFAKCGGQNGQEHGNFVISSADVVASIGRKGKVSHKIVHVEDGGGR